MSATTLQWSRSGAGTQPPHLKVMVSGPPKSGKTTLLGTMPNLLVGDTEPNANNLESIAHLNVPSVTITSSDALRTVITILGNDTLRKQLAQGTYGIPDIEGFALDTLDTFQGILKKERMAETRKSEFLRDDWGWLKTEMEQIVQAICNLPMHVVFVVHTKTKEMGKGEDSYTVVLPGLQGSIDESIAGMVGYSMLSFRKEEINPATGQVSTKYWLRTEGDATHDFLGTRTAGRLPAIIEPNMKTVYDTVMAGRAQAAQQFAAQAQLQIDPSAAPTALPPAPAQVAASPTAPVAQQAPAQEVAQTQGQPPVVQEPAAAVQTPVETPQAPAAAAAPEQPAAEKPADDQPVNAAALAHLKRVYDALGETVPEQAWMQHTLGQARTAVKMWVAVQQDAAAGSLPEGQTAQTLMLDYLRGQGLLSGAPAAEPKPEVVPDPQGTIPQIKAYVGTPPDLAKVQEVYDKESARDGGGRVTVIQQMVKLGARENLPSAVATAPTAQPPAPEQPAVQTPVETPAQPQAPVTPQAPTADVPTTEEQAVATAAAGLGGQVVGEEINADAPCADVALGRSDCAGKLDDLDMAELAKRRFGKLLCVNCYIKNSQS